jgi:hypothetical protein
MGPGKLGLRGYFDPSGLKFWTAVTIAFDAAVS